MVQNKTHGVHLNNYFKRTFVALNKYIRGKEKNNDPALNARG